MAVPTPTGFNSNLKSELGQGMGYQNSKCIFKCKDRLTKIKNKKDL